MGGCAAPSSGGLSPATFSRGAGEEERPLSHLRQRA